MVPSLVWSFDPSSPQTSSAEQLTSLQTGLDPAAQRQTDYERTHHINRVTSWAITNLDE
ncbi:hypothetical protein WMY93_032664 [Mugilogobius chulae]|uniref:Uncharacterized protein n=1 Tax=Mugilogobius chulae TaxID=88201 RepID=A0AAW0MQU0_9GOBI